MDLTAFNGPGFSTDDLNEQDSRNLILCLQYHIWVWVVLSLALRQGNIAQETVNILEAIHINHTVCCHECKTD